MKFSISIVTYTAINQVKRCIESVRFNSVGHDFELILTANGSKEAAAYFETVNNLLHPVRVIVNETNEGFINPNMRALDSAKGEYFVVLNDDATVPAGWLDRLQQPFLDDPKCAISGPTACELDENFVGRPGPSMDYIEGSCLMIRADLARKYGLFSDYLNFAYCEDADLCLRMREFGYNIHKADFALESHAGGATSATVPGIRELVKHNFTICQKRWAHYLATRRFH